MTSDSTVTSNVNVNIAKMLNEDVAKSSHQLVNSEAVSFTGFTGVSSATNNVLSPSEDRKHVLLQ